MEKGEKDYFPRGASDNGDEFYWNIRNGEEISRTKAGKKNEGYRLEV